MRRALVVVFCGAVTGGIAACADSGPDIDRLPESVDDVSGHDPSAVTYSRVTVQLSEDGDHTVLEEVEVTLAQQLAEQALEEAIETDQATSEQVQMLALSTGSCSTTSLRIYSGANYVGDQLCLVGTGAADLDTWCRVVNCATGVCLCLDHWGGGDIGSYKTGEHKSRLADSGSMCVGCEDERAANTNMRVAPYCSQNAVKVARALYCP